MKRFALAASLAALLPIQAHAASNTFTFQLKVSGGRRDLPAQSARHGHRP
jgi:hypothetical protein